MSGWDDWDDRPELPDEAGVLDTRFFDPNDEWLKVADKNLQIEAMRRWFYARYQDPANDTPYNGREGGYIFIHGGPYDPDEEIQERFGHVVEYGVMEELIQDLYQESGDQWAPVESSWGEDEYGEALSMLVLDRSDPFRLLTDRLDQIEQALKDNNGEETQDLINQLLHSAAITALEAYLLDTFSYWIKSEKDIFRIFVLKNPDFSKEKFSLSVIFEKMDKLEETIKDYLQDFVWHRLDKVKPMIEATFEITVPKIEGIMKEVVVRHHIVHRGGRDKDGDPVRISPEYAQRLTHDVREFAQGIEAALLMRFPRSEIPVITDLNDL